jgi:hypothetical protein
LNSKNITYQLNELLNNIDDKDYDTDEDTDDGTIYSLLNIPRNEEELGFRVVLNKDMFEKLCKPIKESKLYYFLIRCLHEDIHKRTLLYL